MKVIEDEIGVIVMDNHTYYEVAKLINTNPLLNRPNSFYDYFSRAYISHTVMGMRRQIKRKDPSVSIARLFEEMIATPEAFTREYFVSLYKMSSMKKYANQDFERFAKHGALHIDPELIREDLTRLDNAARNFEEFSDKRIAHRDKGVVQKIPTFEEVDRCVALLDELFAKYYLLFYASEMDSLLPVWHYDWKDIFLTPWLIRDEDNSA